MEVEEGKPILFGFGNTMICWFVVADQSLLDKYDLKFGFPKELTLEQTPVLTELKDFDGYHEMPDGSAVSTVRTFNYLMNTEHNIKHSALYFGAIGTDDRGESIKKLLDSEGIDYRLEEHEGFETDLWAIIIVDGERTPVSFCRVNQKYTTEHITANIDLLSSCKVLYVSGFFVSNNYEAIQAVMKYGEEHNIKFAFNLNGEYWIETYSDKFTEIIQHCDLLFGNNNEIKSLAKILGFESSDTEKWVRFVASYSTACTNNKPFRVIKERLVLISMDKNGAILDKYSFETEAHEIINVPSVKLEDHEVVDTWCAGDAFVGGFLAGYLSGKDLESSVNDGHKIAAKVIQKIGCYFE